MCYPFGEKNTDKILKMERLSDESPFFRCRHPAYQNEWFVDESGIYETLAGALIKADCTLPGSEYGLIKQMKVTSHRILLILENDCLAIRLDEIDKVEIRKKFLSTNRLGCTFTNCHFNLSLKIKDDEILNTVYQTLSRLISRQPWLSTGGYLEKASVGGISKISASVTESSARALSCTDTGLVDLMSLKKFANELKETIDKLRSSSDDSEKAAYRDLMNEYGLSADPSQMSHSTTESKIESMINQAVTASPAGIMFAHDLFCLVNRGLKLEAVLTPREFMDIITNLPKDSSIGVMNVDNYTLVYSRGKFHIERIEEVIGKLGDFFRVDEFAKTLKIADLRLVQSLLTRIEMDTGQICRDNGGEYGDLVFYKNTYFR